MKLSKTIEALCIKQVTKDQVTAFFNETYEVIEKCNIKLKNIYNVNETSISLTILLIIDCFIGTLQSTNVVIGRGFVGKSYIPQPGHQEWATSIECIAANGSSLPPFIIFKGESLI